MRRIDENVYIDDTLVTCAEYQLFIDEMREQGKYYQPDHWTSYQFPKGQGSKPILGVRRSDAVAFCEWLTKRNLEQWIFRLSTQREASHLPIIDITEKMLGYWTNEKNGFSWIGKHLHRPTTPRPEIDIRLSIDKILPATRSLALDTNGELGLEFALSLAIIHLYDRSLKFDNSFISSRNQFVDEINLNYARGVGHFLSVSRVLNSEKFGDFSSSFNYSVAHYVSDELKVDYEYAFTLVSTINYAINRVNASHPDTVIKLDPDLDKDFICAVCKIAERILGRSPAFEGIRLVKERIR